MNPSFGDGFQIGRGGSQGDSSNNWKIAMIWSSTDTPLDGETEIQAIAEEGGLCG